MQLIQKFKNPIHRELWILVLAIALIGVAPLFFSLRNRYAEYALAENQTEKAQLLATLNELDEKYSIDPVIKAFSEKELTKDALAAMYKMPDTFYRKRIRDDIVKKESNIDLFASWVLFDNEIGKKEKVWCLIVCTFLYPVRFLRYIIKTHDMKKIENRKVVLISFLVVLFAHFILSQNKIYHVATIGDMSVEKFNKFISGISTQNGDRAAVVAQTEITYFDTWPLWISNIFYVIYFIYICLLVIGYKEASKTKSNPSAKE